MRGLIRLIAVQAGRKRGQALSFSTNRSGLFRLWQRKPLQNRDKSGKFRLVLQRLALSRKN
jgi:hypothetical protein